MTVSELIKCRGIFRFMNYRKLGKTDLLISEIGFGAWGIGGTEGGAVAYGNVDDKESVRALELAFERGINFFDTSNQYGQGHSEHLLGKTFESKRDNVIFATKGGWDFKNNKKNFSKNYIESCLNDSLKRLRTDYVDLYQLHSPELGSGDTINDLLYFLKEQKKLGKIREIGISLANPNQGKMAIEDYGFSVIQTNFNLVDQRVIHNGLLDLAKENEVGVIVRTPLCFGLLTGNYTAQTIFAEGDHRKNWSQEQIKVWCNAIVLFFDSYKKTQKADMSQAQMALRYCLSFDAVTSVIPGMLTRSHVEENVRTSIFSNIPKEVLKEFERLERENDFFLKR